MSPDMKSIEKGFSTMSTGARLKVDPVEVSIFQHPILKNPTPSFTKRETPHEDIISPSFGHPMESSVDARMRTPVEIPDVRSKIEELRAPSLDASVTGDERRAYNKIVSAMRRLHETIQKMEAISETRNIAASATNFIRSAKTALLKMTTLLKTFQNSSPGDLKALVILLNAFSESSENVSQTITPNLVTGSTLFTSIASIAEIPSSRLNKLNSDVSVVYERLNQSTTSKLFNPQYVGVLDAALNTFNKSVLVGGARYTRKRHAKHMKRTRKHKKRTQKRNYKNKNKNKRRKTHKRR